MTVALRNTAAPPLDRETVERLSLGREEPDFVRESRLAALERYEAAGWPTGREEEWRHFPLRDLPDTGPFVELHPMLADRIGAHDGDLVVVATRRGELKAPARVVSTIRPDTVFVPFHWVGANRLTNDALDPASRMPEFKVCAARLEAAP